MTAVLDDSDTFLFADGDAGHVCDLGSAPDVGDLDVLCIVSNTVVDSLVSQGFVISSDNQDVANMGMYLWRRIAVGGEASTVTVGTVGDHNTFVGWSRWKNIVAADDAVKNVAGTSGNSTPTATSATLAETNELVIAFGGLHAIGAASQNTPVWANSFIGLLAGTQGSGDPGVVGYVAYATNAGTAAVSTSVSWSGAAANDRGTMLLTFTTSEPAAVTAELDATAPAPTVSINAEASATATLEVTAPAPTSSINAEASATAALSATAPAAVVSIDADVNGTAQLAATAPVPTISINAEAAGEAVLDVTAPSPVVSINAFIQEQAQATLTATGPAPRMSISTFGNPIYEEMIAAHPYIGPLLVEALTCICEQSSRIANPPQHCCFRVGTEVIHDAGFSIDQCCEGVAYVAMGDLFPSADSFPEQDIVRQAASNCTPPAWGVYLKVGIIRCIPVGGLDPLDCDGWNEAALQNVYDTVALMKASCCIRDFVLTDPKFTGWSVVIDRQVQGNPLGGCVERYFTMTVQIPNCDC